MFNDTPFIEYLLIGAHTSTWIMLLIFFAFGINIASPEEISATALVLLLPFVYMIGMLFDSIVQLLISPVRNGIRKKVIKDEDCSDEFLAYRSPTLYEAYDARVQRVRVIGAAILNWPLLGIALVVYLGYGWWSAQSIVIYAVCGVLALTSVYGSVYLYFRAYKFRRAACREIRKEDAVEAQRKLAGA
jgi:hypothetical protein